MFKMDHQVLPIFLTAFLLDSKLIYCTHKLILFIDIPIRDGFVTFRSAISVQFKNI